MDLKTKQLAVVDALEDIKGHDIVVYDTAAMPTMFERVVIASGDSTRQVKALGARTYGVEGAKASEWILVDFGDLVVHIMHPTVRSFYNLEEIWGVKSVRLSRPAAKKAPARKAAKRKLPPKKGAKARAKAPRPRRKR